MSYANWVQEWRESGVPEQVVRKYYQLYGEPPEWLTELIVSDDKSIGIGPLTINYSNEDIVKHDLFMLLSRYGKPIRTPLGIQWEFLYGTIKRGAGGLIFGVLSPGIALVGATVGLGIMVWRAL